MRPSAFAVLRLSLGQPYAERIVDPGQHKNFGCCYQLLEASGFAQEISSGIMLSVRAGEIFSHSGVGASALPR